MPVEFLDLTNLEIVDAHLALGKDVKPAVHKRLNFLIDRIGESQVFDEIEKVRNIRKTVEDRSKGQDFISLAIRSYLECCKAWAVGTDLENFHHSKLAKIKDISSIDLAIFLQLELTGCQTGMYRQEDGSIILWHTEEDVDEKSQRFDKLRVAAFRSGNKIVNSFIYPDLLPGPAFSWTGSGTAIAIDSLPVISNSTVGFFANLIYWIVLFFHEDLPVQAIVSELLPSVDSGAINIVGFEKEAHGEIFEFAIDQVKKRCLGSQPASFLFQTNISNSFNIKPDGTFYEAKSDKQHYYVSRETRTAQAVKKLKDPSLLNFFHLLTSMRGGEYAYANRDVKAHFLIKVTNDEYEVWMGSGMAKPNILPIKIKKIISKKKNQCNRIRQNPAILILNLEISKVGSQACPRLLGVIPPG